MASRSPEHAALFAKLKQIESAAADAPTSLAGEQARTVIEQAALLGRFDLGWLDRQVGGESREMVKSAVLDASECIDRAAGTWRLRLDRRQGMLADLLADPARLDRRLEESDPIAGDSSGDLLRKALRGEPIGEIATLDDDCLPTLLEAASWMQGMDSPLPDPHAIRREHSARARIAAFAEMSARFVGREDELRRLVAFISRPAGQRIPSLPVSGIGGIGKSALIARFLQQRLTRAGADDLLVVHMDFDRVGLGASDRTHLDFELTRQLALAAPELAPDLERIRREVREYRQERSRAVRKGGDDEAATHEASESASLSLEADTFSGSDILFEVSHLCETRAMLGRTLLFVFDTMEELQAESDWAVRALAQWLTQVQVEARFTDIRVVACGRVVVELPAELGFVNDDPVVLDELEPEHAAKLVTGLGLEPKLAARVVTEFGGNPLILRLVARLIEQSGAAILDEPDDAVGREVDKEIVQGMLYQRVLGHIRDKRVRALAHPGLVLRQVTPQLLREVIAPVCLEQPLAPGEETGLFQALKREVWLVDAAKEPDTVEHRTDIRRLMMTMMRKDRTRAQQAQTVHRRAIDYYETGSGKAAPLARQEALYHRFMIAGGGALPALDSSVAREAQAAIGTYGAELPDENRAALRAALGQSLSDEEARLLPDYLWASHVAVRGPELVAQERYVEALDLLDLRAIPLAGPVPAWQAAAMDSLARWRELALLYQGAPQPEPGTAEWLELRGALAGALLRAGDVDQARAVAGEAAAADHETRDRRILAARFRCGSYEARALDASGGDASAHVLPFTLAMSDLLADETLAIEHLRYVQATGRTGQHSFRPSHLLFYPSLPWLERLIEIGGPVVAESLGELVGQLRGLDPRRLSTGRLLGHFATLFARAMIDPFVRSAIPPEALAQIGAIAEHPEFRPASRVALGEVLTSDADRHAIAAALAPALPIVPNDLDPNDPVTHAGPSDFVTALVAYADRCQLLPELLGHAIRLFGPKPMLVEVADALALWRTKREREAGAPNVA